MAISSKFIKTSDLDLTSLLSSEKVLGIIEFNHGKSNLKVKIPESIPYFAVDLKPFETESLFEVWVSDQDVEYGTTDNFDFASDGEYLFAAGSTAKELSLQKSAKNLYDETFSLMKDSGYSCPLRMWNFIPAINQQENYQLFCKGRKESFINNGIETYPAATGIGSYSKNASVYFVSSKKVGSISLENPNQTPAYSYPSQNGLKAPVFSRATFYNGTIFVSGTASIIGNESVCTGDVEKQCLVTFENIKKLISKENLLKYGIESGYTLENLVNIKVYIRNKEDYPVIKELCGSSFSSCSSIAYFNTDICRPELLVEIEGMI